MKKFSRIFLALVLSLSLLTGSIGIPVFAEEGGTEVPELVTAPEGELPEETDGALNAAAGLSTSVPEREYYPINHTDPLNYVAGKGNVSGQLVNWVYIENDGKEKGPQQTAVTLGAANGHRNNVGVESI